MRFIVEVEALKLIDDPKELPYLLSQDTPVPPTAADIYEGVHGILSAKGYSIRGIVVGVDAEADIHEAFNERFN